MKDEKERKEVTPEQLGQLRALNREIAAEKDRLAQLRALKQGKQIRAEGIPYLGPEQARRQYEPEIRAIEEKIEENLSRCLEQLAWLEDYIGQVEDSQMRQILSLRYVSGLTWQQTAFRMGHYDEQVPRRKHRKFFENQGKEKRKCR